MGGLIVRYMIEEVQSGDSHFPPLLFVSDVVTFSAPHGGIWQDEAGALGWNCTCSEANEMVYDSGLGEYAPFMVNIMAHDHPDASADTDWTMLGSLGTDPLDWDYQATYMSNSNGLSNNHRIGYSYPITCNGASQYGNGYGHGDYMLDTCDAFDAPYYYCDGCSRTQYSNFSYTSGAPHSLHEMLFAFVYINW